MKNTCHSSRIKLFSLISLIACCLYGVKAQNEPADTSKGFHHKAADEAPAEKPTLVFSGYVDAYYAYYSEDSLGTVYFQKFPTAAPKRNAFGITTVQFTTSYTANRIRLQGTLHWGDLANSSWESGANGWLKFVQEANGGVRLVKSLWLEGGFFRTFIGTEGALPKENLTSSVAVPTWHQPYYMSGFRLSYDITSKLVLRLYVVNQYNGFLESNKKKHVGFIATYAVSDKVTVCVNGIYGDDTPDSVSASHLRAYNSAMVTYMDEKFKLVAGADVATQKNSKLNDGTSSALMFNVLAAVKYYFIPEFALYGRGEYFSDPQGFLGSSYVNSESQPAGLQIGGITVGAEYKPFPTSYVRLESRMLKAADKYSGVFYHDGELTNMRWELLFNVGVWF